MIRRAALLAAAGLTLGLVACSQSQVTETLALVVTAADAAVTTLQATGQIPPGTATLITNYLSEVSTGVSFATMELASSDSSALEGLAYRPGVRLDQCATASVRNCGGHRRDRRGRGAGGEQLPRNHPAGRSEPHGRRRADAQTDQGGKERAEQDRRPERTAQIEACAIAAKVVV